MKPKRIPLLATSSYIVFIVLINTAVAYWPKIVIFSSPVSTADVLVGAIYLVRDFAQREIKHYVFIAMLIGAILSFFLANHAIAIASVSAFVIGEVVDWAIYTFTKRPLSQRLILSSVASSPLDSVVFLAIMHQLSLVAVVLLIAAKMVGIGLLWSFWKMRDRHMRDRHICIPLDMRL